MHGTSRPGTPRTLLVWCTPARSSREIKVTQVALSSTAGSVPIGTGSLALGLELCLDFGWMYCTHSSWPKSSKFAVAALPPSEPPTSTAASASFSTALMPNSKAAKNKPLKAIVQGLSPVVYIAGTGGGKSLAFMLPSYIARDGVTIVIVPFVALQQDIAGRCRSLRIPCEVWSPREVSSASVILVTLESICTKPFWDFLNRLVVRQQLDRIVFDECYTVLDSSLAFRPKLRDIGTTLEAIGFVMLAVLRSVTDRITFVPSSFHNLSAVAAVTLGWRTCFQNLRGEITMPNSDSPVCSLFFKHSFHCMFQCTIKGESGVVKFLVNIFKDCGVSL